MWSSKYYSDLEQHRKVAREGGGIQRIAKQLSRGKLTARQRLSLLFDGGVFHETDQLTSSRCTDFDMQKKSVPGDGVVTAYGLVNGRTVFAAAQDFTVSGGAGGEEYALKMCHLLELAIEARAPFVCLNDSGGARIEEGVSSLSAYSRLFHLNTVASGLIPQIAAIMGPCAGGSSYSPALCDFIFMVKGTSQMYLTGPSVIKTVTGESVTVDDLGGPLVHSAKSGVAHFVSKDDASCLAEIRKLLAYLPQSCDQKPPFSSETRPVNLCRGLEEVVVENQRLAYDVRAVIGSFVDRHSFLEVHASYAKNIVVGLARLNGNVLGVVANQPKSLGGALDANAADKAARFVRFCDCFNIPLLSLVDAPGFLPGKDQEYSGVIRHGAKLPYAFSEATVPKVCLILRKAYGGAFSAMNGKSLSADIVFAWPIAQIAVMGAAGAVSIIFRKEIAAAADPAQKREELEAEYEKTFMNPYAAASRGFVDEVITPAETRAKIVSAFTMLENKKEERPLKKHGNIPL